MTKVFENKYKETRGTKRETDSEKFQKETRQEHVHVFRIIFYSIFMEGTGALTIPLCIVKSLFHTELSRRLFLPKCL